MQKNKTKALIKIYAGTALVVLQIFSVAGMLLAGKNVFQEAPKTWGQFFFDLMFYLGFFLPSILGAVLIVWGIVALKPRQKIATEKKKKQAVAFGSLKIMMSVALLAAVSIVCGKVLAIPGGDVMRFSFENLPILLAGMAFGPIVGCVTGIVADLLGCLMVGYAINPLVTAGAAAIGLISGILFWILKKSPCLARVGVTVFTAHLVGSVVVKTFGLAKFYSFPFLTLMAWRGLNYLIVGALEFVILYVLFRSKAFTDQLNKLKR